MSMVSVREVTDDNGQLREVIDVNGPWPVQSLSTIVYAISWATITTSWTSIRLSKKMRLF